MGAKDERRRKACGYSVSCQWMNLAQNRMLGEEENVGEKPA